MAQLRCEAGANHAGGDRQTRSHHPRPQHCHRREDRGSGVVFQGPSISAASAPGKPANASTGGSPDPSPFRGGAGAAPPRPPLRLLGPCRPPPPRLCCGGAVLLLKIAGAGRHRRRPAGSRGGGGGMGGIDPNRPTSRPPLSARCLHQRGRHGPGPKGLVGCGPCCNDQKKNPTGYRLDCRKILILSGFRALVQLLVLI